MSFYRTLIAVVAAMGLATAAIAADENTNATQSNTEASQPAQLADSSSQDATQAPAEQTKINLNTATAKELMKVKGLTAAKAKAIVVFRKKHGEFKTLDDLKQVKGFKKMNEKTMKDIQDQLTLG
jgi:competence protein ComEA